MIDWLQGLDRWPRALPELRLSLAQSALIVVDVQNYIARPDAGLGRRFAEQFPEDAEHYFSRIEDSVFPALQRLLSLFRDSSRPIVFLAFGSHREDGFDLRSARRKRDDKEQRQRGQNTTFASGTVEHSVCAELSPGANEPVITKITSGGFLSTGLDVMLRNLGATDLVVGGLVTNGCVESTINEAADRGYRVAVAEDACASFDPDAHRATLRNFRRLRGVVLGSEEIVIDLSAARAGEGDA